MSITVRFVWSWLTWLIFIAAQITMLLLRNADKITWSWFAVLSPTLVLGALAQLMALYILAMAVDAAFK